MSLRKIISDFIDLFDEFSNKSLKFLQEKRTLKLRN